MVLTHAYARVLVVVSIAASPLIGDTYSSDPAASAMANLWSGSDRLMPSVH